MSRAARVIGREHAGLNGLFEYLKAEITAWKPIHTLIMNHARDAVYALRCVPTG
jgi:hypothetical protein